MQLRRLHVLCAAGMLVLVAPVGCVSMDDLHAARQHAATLQQSLTTEEALLQARLDALATDDPEHALLQARLASSRTARHALDAAINEVDFAISRERDPGSIFGFLASMLPEPWRAPIILGGAAAALFLRSRQLKAGLKSVARGIEIAKREDETFRDRFDANANIFRSIQTPAAQKVVDEVTNRPARVPI